MLRAVPHLKGLHDIWVWLKKEVEEAVAEQAADAARWKLLKTCMPSKHDARIPRLGIELCVLTIGCEETMERIELESVDGFLGTH